MLQSKYSNTINLDPTEDLKKKLLKKQDAFNNPSEEVKPVRPVNEEEASTYKANANSQITSSTYADSENKLEEKTLNPELRTGGQKAMDGIMAGAGGLMDMASEVMTNKEDMSKKERQANTMKMGTKGMSTGASIGTAIGGPGLGTAVGAGVGLLAGVGTALIQGAGDQKRLDNKAKLERINYITDVKDKRKRADMLNDGLEAVEKEKNVLGSQMGMVKQRYS